MSPSPVPHGPEILKREGASGNYVKGSERTAYLLPSGLVPGADVCVLSRVFSTYQVLMAV